MIRSLFVVVACACAFPRLGAAQAVAARRPISDSDIAAWNNINSVTLSPDGRWVASVQSSASAGRRLVLQSTSASPKPPLEIQGASGLVFSVDSRWAAYRVR